VRPAGAGRRARHSTAHHPRPQAGARDRRGAVPAVATARAMRTTPV